MDREGRAPLLVRTPIEITINTMLRAGGTFMSVKRLVITAVSLSMGLAGMHGSALAQIKDAPIVTGNVSGNCVTSPSVNTTGANAGDWTITCGDISPGPGLTVIGPPSAVLEPAPIVAPEPVAAPENEPAPVVAEPASELVATDTAAATETDLDADNYPDELEWDRGLDPNNPDTDADGAADGDEINLYGTEPTVADTDGDGVLDGEELFGIRTNPLVWDDFSTDESTQSLAQEAATAPVQTLEQTSEVASLGQETSENLSATNGDAAALGTGDASAAPGSVTRGGLTVPGASLLGPDGKYSVSEISPPNVSVSGNTSAPPVIVPAPGTAPAPEAVVETVETTEPVAAETAVASVEDLDGDNYVDALELDAGLDPGNPDVDGDGLADGDEVNIYFTDPWTWDTDGDGLSDGDELFGTLTDPLLWDTDGDGVEDGQTVV
jgi:Bacterial TSP3 repeat